MKWYAVIGFAIGFALTACGSDSSGDAPERPGEEPRVDPEVSDASMRISGSVLNLNFEDGGIIFSRSADGAVISGVRLRDGIGFDFDTERATLQVNGVDIPLNSVKLLERRGTTEWYRLTLYDKKSHVYIVADL